MTPDFVVGFAQEAIKTTILVSMPMLGLGLAVGLVISIFQAVTQINEMTLTFVPKILIWRQRFLRHNGDQVGDV